MTVLTIYTNNYDSRENVYGRGMSGKVFLETIDDNKEDGAAFNSIDEALDYCIGQGLKPDRIDFNYLAHDGSQKFWKLEIK